MSLLPEGDRRVGVEGGTPERTVLINQMLLAAVTLFATAVALLLGEVVRATTFTIGLTLVFAGAAVAIVVPWRRLPAWAAGALPVVDIVAIAFIREGTPTAGLGLLWAVPAMWLAALFGVVGVIGSTVAITVLLVVMAVSDPASRVSASTFLLPLLVAALGILVALATRRAVAQRELLEKQSAHLRHSVRRARRQEDLVTEVLDAVDFGVIRITRSGELVVTNEAHGRLQGGAAGLRMFARDGITPLDAECAPLARAQRGETFENELVWYGAPGEGRRALTVTARLLTDPDGSPAGMIVVSRDVTSEEQALRAREDLVASVSHELRTPLTSIIGYLELALDRPDLPDATRRDLGVAERNAGRLLEIVTDILALSAASRHGVDLRLQREHADVADIVNAAVEALAPRAAERRMTIDTTAVQSAFASIDPHRVRQVADNLLSNAVKYGRDGGTVRAGVASDGTHAWFTVSDDGPGISTDEQPLLFERFFRSDAVRNSSTHGSGLGLAISRDIVRAHGGEIFVYTQPGNGATFTVRLPLARLGEGA